MKIYTSYYGNVRNLPDEMMWISISLFRQPWMSAMAPGFDSLYPSIELLKWFKSKECHKTKEDIEVYTKRYKEETLSKLNQHVIVNQLKSWSNGKDIVLLCYERPENFCHRHIVADWLKEAGYAISELKHKIIQK